MTTRVTDSMVQRTSLADVQFARRRLAEVQEQASSGLRINRPSDDPVGYRTATALRSTLASSQQLLRNQDRSTDRLQRLDSSMGETQTLMQRARELAIRGASGSATQDPATRRILAEEVAGLFDQMLSQANLDSPDGHLYAGHANDTAPFVVSGPFGSGPPAPSVSFVGNSSEIELEVDEGVFVATTLDGRRVFLGDSDGDGLTDGGRENVFETLGGLWEALMANDPAAVSPYIDRLDAVGNQFSTERTRMASSAQRTQAASDSVRDREVSLKRQLSNVQDADTVSVLSELVSRQTALQSSLEAAARVIQPSLLDFLG